MTADITDFYLGTPLDESEWMWVRVDQIPESIMLKYNLLQFVSNGRILFEVVKGMYGLAQAGRLAQDRLVSHLSTHGYIACSNTPCFFTHTSRPISFTLVVDDFGIKYVGMEHANHLLTALQGLYAITVDWTGSKYVGITLQWDYASSPRKIICSMPGYVARALKRFNITPTKPVHSPLPYQYPIFGQPTQLVVVDTTPPLDAAGIKWVQEVVGVFLFLARAIDVMSLCALSKLDTQQSAPTENTKSQINHFLRYMSTWSEPSVTFWQSEMILKIDSDGSHQCERNSGSRAATYQYCGNSNDDMINGSIYAASTVIQTVTSAVAETEYAATYLACKPGSTIRDTLADMGHPQQATLVTCDNSAAVRIGNGLVNQKRTKAVDMRYHWVRDRVKDSIFKLVWTPGRASISDFFTKIHSFFFSV